MPNDYFQFKKFIIKQDKTAMKVCTDSCILGAYIDTTVKNRILDIGTGTGLLTLMLAQRYQVPIDAVEINREAVQQARENIRRSPWSDRIDVFHEDINNFKNISPLQYDLIVCNPPFYTNHLQAVDVAKNQAMHNQCLPPEVLVQSISRLLSRTGTSYVLLPPKQGEYLEKLASGYGLYINKKLIIRDRPGSNVLRIILKIRGIRTYISEDHLTVKNSGGDYSARFRQLLGPYYLRL